MRTEGKPTYKLTVDAAMSTVSAAADVGGTVDLHVADNQILDVEALELQT